MWHHDGSELPAAGPEPMHHPYAARPAAHHRPASRRCLLPARSASSPTGQGSIIVSKKTGGRPFPISFVPDPGRYPPPSLPPIPMLNLRKKVPDAMRANRSEWLHSALAGQGACTWRMAPPPAGWGARLLPPSWPKTAETAWTWRSRLRGALDCDPAQARLCEKSKLQKEKGRVSHCTSKIGEK
jgi:hypothetical protein